MKICYDNLENIKLASSGDFAGKGGYYIEKESCSVCGEPYLMKKNIPTSFCSNSCSKKGKNNPMYKECGVYYKKYTDYLDISDINSEDKFYTAKELSVWSKEVLKRANYKCEYCGKKAEHAHHINPKKIEPGLALDPDNGLACCSECHYKYGHVGECSTVNLAKIKCK